MKTKYDEKIIKKFTELDTASISDALDGLGVSGGLLGLKNRTSGSIMAGYAYTVKYSLVDCNSHDFLKAGNYIDNVPAGSVVIVDNEGREECTNWGNILTHKAVMGNIKGTVVWGAVRDIKESRKLNYPIFSKSVFMQSGKNRVIKVAEQCSVRIGKVTINPGDLIVGDENGCVAVPSRRILEVLNMSLNVMNTEKMIVSAINCGVPLQEAREKYHYDKPWSRSEC